MMKKKVHKKDETDQVNDKIPTDNKDINNNQRSEETNSNSDSANSSLNGSTSEAGTTGNNVTEQIPAEEKLAEMQDKYIRLSAEFDNYRKRTLREKMELSKYAEENLLIKVIPLMDDFERALKHMETATDCASMKNGIDLIYIKFSEFLKQNGIKEIESLNSNFNVDLHEAIAKTPVTEDDKKGKVVDVVLKGYFLHDKVLRFSKVVVGE